MRLLLLLLFRRLLVAGSTFLVLTVATGVVGAAPWENERVSAASGRLIQVGPQRPLSSIAMAAVAARDGDTIEIDAGDYLGDVAIWTKNDLKIRAVGGRVRLLAGGQAAEGKAIWVIRSGSMLVEGIDFLGAKVADRNGAGIRFEKGRLLIRNCLFRDNENGILTAGDKTSELRIENSEFGHNGFGDGRSHNIYVGTIAKLTVTGSYFHHANVGHLLKSRAGENHIRYNRLTDETGGRASYELEFPNGGLAYVVGNIIQQGPQSENSIIISYGAEGYSWPKNELYLVNNTLVDDRPSNGIFLMVKPGAQRLVAQNNLLLGKGGLDLGETERLGNAASVQSGGFFSHNLKLDRSDFAQASRYDYRLLPTSRAVGQTVAVGAASGIALTPRREYVHPRQTRAISNRTLQPGALQTLAGED